MLRAFFNFTAHALLATWAVALIAAGEVNRARAQGASAPPQPSWAVEVAAGSACANDPTFRERLDAAIPARQRAPLERAELRARVAVARDQKASLSVFDQQSRREAGQRQITVPRGGCGEAAEALALVIAVMVEAGRSLLPPPEAEAEPPPPPPPEPEPTPSADEPPSGKPEYKRPDRYAWQGPPIGHDLALQVGVDLGLLPGNALGGTAGWGIRGHRIWPVWISGTAWLTQRSEDMRARIGAAYGTLGTCPLYLKGRFIRGRICPGVAAGAIWATGDNLPAASHTVSFLALGSLAGALHVRLIGPLELSLEARLEIPLWRLRFTYYRADGMTPESHETAVVTGSFFGGLGLCFR